jgi:hypothetical protein
MDELEEKICALSSDWWSPEEIAEELGEPKDRIEAIKAVLERMLDSPPPDFKCEKRETKLGVEVPHFFQQSLSITPNCSISFLKVGYLQVDPRATDALFDLREARLSFFKTAGFWVDRLASLRAFFLQEMAYIKFWYSLRPALTASEAGLISRSCSTTAHKRNLGAIRLKLGKQCNFLLAQFSNFLCTSH